MLAKTRNTLLETELKIFLESPCHTLKNFQMFMRALQIFAKINRVWVINDEVLSLDCEEYGRDPFIRLRNNTAFLFTTLLPVVKVLAPG